VASGMPLLDLSVLHGLEGDISNLESRNFNFKLNTGLEAENSEYLKTNMDSANLCMNQKLE
jgi:hypothetical protein